MPTDVPLRLAVRGDAPAIAALSRDRIEHGLGWRWTAARVLRAILDPASNVVVSQDTGNGRLLGFGIMQYHDLEAHLLLLAVSPNAARRGIGSVMLHWLERSARVAGVGQVYLESRLTNQPARAFYARAGYREIQVVPGYYQGQEAAVRLAKDLWLTPVAPG
jgi:ribosomal-protein-alanine N-acetyltransferase